MMKNWIERISSICEKYKDTFQAIASIGTFLSLLLLFFQTISLSSQTSLLSEEVKNIDKQTEILKNKLKYNQFISRVSFVHDYITNSFGKGTEKINEKLVKDKNIKGYKLTEHIDKFEYLFQLYKEYGIFKEGEIDVYFKSYIINACNSNQVMQKLEQLNKHRGFKQFCCRYYSNLKKQSQSYYDCEKFEKK